ncbi:MAG: HD domain-containing phosphohydrolase [Thermodesulfobacteriota bacterium]
MNVNAPTILTIDDESLIRESFRFYLEDCGFNVLEAENGKVGINIIREKNPDLVLVDLRMPEVDGLEVLQFVQEHYKDLPIIVISGTGYIGDAVEAMNRGAWSYLLKPISDFNSLRYAVEQALEKSRLIAENKSYREHLEEKVQKRTKDLEHSNRLLRDTRMQVILRLGKASEYRDKETGRHIIRVSCYTKILAAGLGFDDEEADIMSLGSALHDLGKISISDTILLKPGKLTDEEWAKMREHCHLGRELLKPLTHDDIQGFSSQPNESLEGIFSDSELLQMARVIAYSHHEHWDGTGYPEGLKGEEIPLPARIVAAVDIYDAIGSKRPYKDAYSEDKCLEIMRESSGTTLDPKVVDVFFDSLDLLQQIKEKWAD